MNKQRILPVVASIFVFTTFLAPAAFAEVTMASWGGSYTVSQQKAYGEPWMKKTGRKANWVDYSGGLGEIRTQVEAKKVVWDVVDVLPHEAVVGCDEGLFVKLPFDEFVPAPNGKSMVEDMKDLGVPPVSECAAPNIYWSYLITYDGNKYKGNEPTSINDFFDVKKYPGKRGVHGWGNALIEMALVADGVAVGDVYKVMNTKEGLDRAFNKLNTIKDHVVFWSAGSQPLEMVKSGEVVMSTAYNGRPSAAVLTEGENFGILWDGQVLEQQYFVILNGSMNEKEALDFVKFITAPEQQAGQAKYIPYAPMRRSGQDIIEKNEPWFHNGKNVLPHMPLRKEVAARSVVADPIWWADNGGEISERFNAWKGQ